jgi:hypothetical protein
VSRFTSSFPPDSSLTAAHEVAERVEAEIGELPHVSDVRTHLEPIEQPIATDPAAEHDSDALQTIKTVVQRYAHTSARDLRLMATGQGDVLFMTISVGVTASLTQAHRLASELEQEPRHELPRDRRRRRPHRTLKPGYRRWRPSRRRRSTTPADNGAGHLDGHPAVTAEVEQAVSGRAPSKDLDPA